MSWGWLDRPRDLSGGLKGSLKHPLTCRLGLSEFVVGPVLRANPSEFEARCDTDLCKFDAFCVECAEAGLRVLVVRLDI